jgi:hypothetical protein
MNKLNTADRVRVVSALVEDNSIRTTVRMTGVAKNTVAKRQNLTMRMAMRRFTRLTNGFSKKMENLAHAVAIHFMHYDFCRIHQSQRVTPAMEAKLTTRLWEIEDLVALID